MANRVAGRILRCTGLALLVLGFFVLMPSKAQAQCTLGNHGVSVFKSCTSPSNRCATDADCSDGNLCNGLEQCATEEATGSNKVSCNISIANPTSHCDNITITEAADAILNGTGSPTSSSTILVTGTTGTVSGDGCNAGSDIGSVLTETCTLNPGASITFLANYYTVQALDPTPLNDQATLTVVDTCSGSGPNDGCNGTANNVQFGASTTLVSGCSPGTPLNCDDSNACTNDSCVPATGCAHATISCDDSLFCTDDSCVPATGCAHTTHNCDDADACTIDSCNETTDVCDHESDPACVPAPGRMTGGGSVFDSATKRSSKTEGRVTHGFELHCDPEVGPNNLEVNWGPGNHFHMEELLTAVCTDDPTIEPPPPPADFDTYDGTGTGRCNGEPGASIVFQFTDAGEPGTGDHATINITGCPGGLSLSVSGFLKKGNHQAHRQN